VAAEAQGTTIVELVRLGVVVATTAVGYEAGQLANLGPEPLLVGATLGALLGCLVGGGVGRKLVRTVDETQARLRRVESVVVVAGAVGAVFGTVLSLALAAPLMILPGRSMTLPIAFAGVVVSCYLGARLGMARGGDLGRYVGVRGRIEVSSPAHGDGVKVVDSSALIDGRLLAVARVGFLEGTLVIPRFVVAELQGLADADDRRQRIAGRRGLDTITALQKEHLVVVEVTDEDPLELLDVDGKLARVARDRDATLVTLDTGRAQVAEVSGLRVLDMHALAAAMRPPAIPGDRLYVEVTRTGREPDQGIAHLPDGTMVVIERSADVVGETVEVEVTSINQTNRGRMLFAVRVSERGPA
jgi:uncharacterized protein YacL